MRGTAYSLSILLGLLAAGCGSESSGSWPVVPSIARVEFDLRLSSADGSAASPIIATATVRNTGTAPAFGVNPRGCPCDGLEFDILDSAGQSMLLVDPCVPVPVCLCTHMVLNGGGHVRPESDLQGREVPRGLEPTATVRARAIGLGRLRRRGALPLLYGRILSVPRADHRAARHLPLDGALTAPV